jgi:hypothetical protein
MITTQGHIPNTGGSIELRKKSRDKLILLKAGFDASCLRPTCVQQIRPPESPSPVVASDRNPSSTDIQSHRVQPRVRNPMHRPRRLGTRERGLGLGSGRYYYH